MKKYVQTNRKKILIFIGILIGITILLMPTDTKNFETEYKVSSRTTLESVKEVTDEEKLGLILAENQDSIKFMANTFLINEDILLERLRNNYEDLDLLNVDIDFDKVILDYLLKLEDEEKDLFQTARQRNTMNKDYIVNVLKYFCDFYTDVNFSIAAAIAEVESGFTHEGMLQYNNIYGGLYTSKYGKRLIRYKTIEYGVLKYVILLNDGYFSKGLLTVEDIGKVYNPTIQDGVKVVSSSWVYNVTNAINKYVNINSVDTSLLMDLKNN